MNKQYIHAVVGGTFDHFHKGHKVLLTAAFSQAETITIGVSTAQLYNQKALSETIEDLEERITSVRKFIKDNKFEERAKIITIDNIYGTTLSQENIEAIFVTEENKKVAYLINEKRKELNFAPLAVEVIDFVFSDDGKVLSSERIRKGEISREGFVYASLFRHHTFVLPPSLRARLRTPIGSVFQESQKILTLLTAAPLVITVGDIVTVSLALEGRQADLSVVDFKTRRQELHGKQHEVLARITAQAQTAKNEPGKITYEAFVSVQAGIERFFMNNDKQTIIIDGEEDLLTLPAILLAPLQSVVIYGQYDQGAVLVVVTEEKKQEIYELIELFEKENL